MKKIMFTYYVIACVIGIAVSVLMDIRTWKELLKNLICVSISTSLIILIGREYNWTIERTMLAIIISSCYARPVVYGVNRLIKEFFKDPKAFIDKYKGK